MRKFIGWLMIIFCSIMIVPLVMILLMTLTPEILPRTADMGMTVSEILSALPGFLIVCAILIYVLVRGIKKVRKEKTTDFIEYAGELDINISGQISYRDYRNLMMNLSFKKPVYLIYTGIFALLLISLLNNKNGLSSIFESSPFIFVIIGVFALSPFLTLMQVKKLYQGNKILHERVAYSLSNESIHMCSESVDSNQKWTNFMKVKETKGFFMLYQSKNAATFLDKKMFADTELVDFRRFLYSLNITRK